MEQKNRLMLGTRKGLAVFEKGPQGNYLQTQMHFLGIPVSIAAVDERNGTWWALLDHGHWGCKVHKSTDEGKTWKELESPKYPEGEEIKDGVPASVKYLWAFAHGGKDRPEELFLGSEPGGLFQSKDQGTSFQLNRGLWDHPSRKEQWFGGGRDFPGIHSIIVDPRDSDHIFVGISCAGVFESRDGGTNWIPKNKGLKADFLPDANSEIGQDPHLLVASKNHPDYLWQQNHCGIFKSENGGELWEEVGQKAGEGPANFGFAIAVDENKPEVAWVVPANSDQIRVAVDGALCVCRTDDGGKTWTDFRKGLPQENCFDIVFRHALDKSGETLAFGTTTGNLYLSDDYGESWKSLSNNMPMIYSVEFY